MRSVSSSFVKKRTMKLRKVTELSITHLVTEEAGAESHIPRNLCNLRRDEKVALLQPFLLFLRENQDVTERRILFLPTDTSPPGRMQPVENRRKSPPAKQRCMLWEGYALFTAAVRGSYLGWNKLGQWLEWVG